MSNRKTNMVVRGAMAEKGLTQWQLANLFDMSETTISRMFRYEWDEETQRAVAEMIKGVRQDKTKVAEMLSMQSPSAKRNAARKKRKEAERTERHNARMVPGDSSADEYANAVADEVEKRERRRNAVRDGWI